MRPFATENSPEKFINGRKEYTCSLSGLPVLELEEFIGVRLNGEYRFNIRKIGNSILHIQNSGDATVPNMRKFYELVDDFVVKAEVKIPFVEIRDMRQITGSPPSSVLRYQRDYLMNTTTMSGFIVCNNPVWIRMAIQVAVKVYPPIASVHSVKNFAKSLPLAIEITEKKSAVKTDESKEKKLSFDDIEFGTGLEYTSPKTGASYQNGNIFGKVWYSKIVGDIELGDIEHIEKKADMVFNQGGLIGKDYYRVADYSETGKSSFLVRKEYTKMLNRIKKKHDSKASATFIVGASARMKAILTVFGAGVNQKLTFVDTAKKAFDYMNSHHSPSDTILVNYQNLEEINFLFGSLLWDLDTADKKIGEISPGNPLAGIARNIEVVREDLAELRERNRNSLNTLKSILNAINIGVAVIEKKSNFIVFVNNFLEKLTLRSSNELLEIPARMLFDESFDAESIEEDSNYRPLKRKDGSTKTVMTVGKEIVFKGELSILVTLVDVTEQEKMNLQLKEALNKSEKMVRFMEGREDRIIELKQEVNNLRLELGIAPKYKESKI